MGAQESIAIPQDAPAAAPGTQDESPNNMGFRLLDLPVKIRKRILKMVLQKPGMVKPFYYTGCVELPEDEVTKPNLDVSPLLVNKQLHIEAAETLYGANQFEFTDARLALWWFKHIGPRNVPRIQSAHFSLGAWEHPAFMVREERLWQIAFTWLAPRQRLDTISLSFDQWNALDQWTGSDQWADFGQWAAFAFDQWNSASPDRDLGPIRSARDGALRALASFRGLDNIDVTHGTYLTHFDIVQLAHAMLAKSGESVPATDDLVPATDD